MGRKRRSEPACLSQAPLGCKGERNLNPNSNPKTLNPVPFVSEPGRKGEGYICKINWKSANILPQ